MVVKLYDIKSTIADALHDSEWDGLIDVDIHYLNNNEFYVTYSELQYIESNPICLSKYKVTIELCNE